MKTPTKLHPLTNLDGHINVLSGRKVNLLNPQIDEIDIQDIAQGLSSKPHFGGHCRPWFSIAQHCALVVTLMERDGAPLKHLQAALLHDASEAYLSDIVKPLKVQPEFKRYRELEEKWMNAIARKFDVNPLLFQEVKPYDLRAQSLEYNRFYLDDYTIDGYLSAWHDPSDAYMQFLFLHRKLFKGGAS